MKKILTLIGLYLFLSIANVYASGFFEGGGGGTSTIDDLTDVTITSDSSGQILVRNAGDTAYENVSMSGDATLSSTGALTIGSNSVALGTDTTGNYVATIADSGATEVTVANSGAESAAVTLAIASGITRDTEWDTVAEIETATGAVNILLETEIDASSELLALMDDETGTGVLTFATSPTFTTSQTTNGTVQIVESGGTTTYGRLGQSLEINTTTNYGGFDTNIWSANAGHGNMWDANKSASATPGTHTIVQDGEQLLYIMARGSNGTSFNANAEIRFIIDGATSSTSGPGRIQFMTEDSGSFNGSTTEAMRINSDQNVTIGSVGSDLGKLGVEGNEDEIQLAIRANATQTAALALFEDSAGNHQITITADGALVVNEEGNDADTRIESDTNANALVVDAGLNQVLFGMGTGAGQASSIGVANVNNTAVGNVGAGEDDLITYPLDANSFSANKRGVRIRAWGTAANNANAKTLKLYFGTQIIVTTSLTVNQVDTWQVEATVWKTGASTQDWQTQLVEAGTATLIDIENGTATQTDTGAITIKCTGEATTNDDILQEGVFIEYIS